jgi:hypothetical protein
MLSTKLKMFYIKKKMYQEFPTISLRLALGLKVHEMNNMLQLQKNLISILSWNFSLPVEVETVMEHV